MRLDLKRRHAADVEDIYFALAVSCILGAAYASHPLIPSATTPSPSAFFPITDMEAGKHQVGDRAMTCMPVLNDCLICRAF